ncbi:hypothetical protein PAECIP111802_05299 [Paenibacillus allorhizosphaerae]|uniref:CBM6 domain-containing protein n=2 Tax=Paenibacillus allorhizosphaerae TaxID=2849866 RepID=A0ABN7TUY2_9BACL|nr:hypothetical protein PAECIP111802_05299 [Paenibacillus allorhizosphaerae]
MNKKRLKWIGLLFPILAIIVFAAFFREPKDVGGISMEGTGMIEKLKDSDTYKNWMSLTVEKKEGYEDDPLNGKNYPAGDPFVMKHNGIYYLYPSTHFGLSDIRAWSSEDLIHWKYEGIVAKDERLKMAYAPEVTYWNGYFYMVTSPSGKGHYVLKSDSPTGPFTLETSNLGMSIDGSVFIDDDGKWYFYNSGSKGIRGRDMPTPLTFGDEHILQGTSMNHWTEGPFLLKRNGTYFMTQTGNHLMSKGYRINYSISKDGPLGKFVTPYNNPIIINTDDGFHGLGHSSTVMGPDLDSYYMVYHNNKNPVAPGIGHDRYLNMDKLVFNGDKMDVLGPTNFPQKVPKRAPFYTWIQRDGAERNFDKLTHGKTTTLVSKSKTKESYTAEFNFRAVLESKRVESKKSQAGVIFSYENESHFGMVSVHMPEKKLELVSVQKEERRSIAAASLPEDLDLTKLHTIRIEKDRQQVKVYFDGMQKLDAEMKDLTAGSIGYVYEDFVLLPDYTAFSHEVNGTSDFEAYKPVPGSIEAVHYLKGKERGYHTKQKPEMQNPFRPEDDIAIDKTDGNTYLVNLNHKGDWLQYNINVKEDATYGIDFRVRGQKEAAELEVYADDQWISNIVVPPADDDQKSGWVKMKGIGNLPLRADLHTLKLKVKRGEIHLLDFDVYKTDLEKLDRTIDLIKGGDTAGGLFSDWTYIGKWSVSNQGLTSAPDVNSMAFTGKTTWSDYTVEADLTLSKTSLQDDAGILIRASNESTHKDQVPDALMGYYISFSPSRVALKKLNYDAAVLEKADVSFQKDKKVHIKIQAEGSTIRVYMDNSPKPILQYTDSNAFTTGKVGVRSTANAVVFFERLSIKSGAN